MLLGSEVRVSEPSVWVNKPSLPSTAVMFPLVCLPLPLPLLSLRAADHWDGRSNGDG